MKEPVSKLLVNRVGSAGAADGAVKWLVHAINCLCPPFRRGLASKMAGRACLNDYARSQATHRQAATESSEIGSKGTRKHGSLNKEPGKSSFRDDLRMLRRFFRYVSPYKKSLYLVYFLYIFNALMNLVPIASLRYYFDLIIIPQPISVFGLRIDTTGYALSNADKLKWSLIYFAVIAAFIVFANLLGILMWRLGTKVTQHLLIDIKHHIIFHLHKLSMSFFDNERTGEIMSRSVGDVMQMQQMLNTSFFLAATIMQVVFVPILMLSMSPLLFLFCAIPLPIIVFSVRRMRYQLRPLYRKLREKEAHVASSIQEQISGMKEIKAFGQEETISRNINRANDAYHQTVNDAMKIFSVNHQSLVGARDIALIITGTAGGLFIVFELGGVTAGALFAFLPLMGRFFMPVIMMTRQYDIVQRGLASMERVFGFLDVRPDIVDSPGAYPVEFTEGRIVFEDVVFEYKENEPVLKNVNIDIPHGQTAALVGSTGSGKSTLVSLIPRFYDPREGRISIDGHDIRKVRMESIRNAIGIVFQETFLFYGTMAQNISFSRPDASMEQVVEAAKFAKMHDFIEGLPDGYDSMVGERGVTLSGGQRQRMAIARMILKDPAIIILDEATSSLDNTTEREIQESLDNLMKDRTSIVIAHRLSTIKAADVILVMEDGRIVERGNYDELIKLGGRFSELEKMR